MVCMLLCIINVLLFVLSCQGSSYLGSATVVYTAESRPLSSLFIIIHVVCCLNTSRHFSFFMSTYKSATVESEKFLEM